MKPTEPVLKTLPCAESQVKDFVFCVFSKKGGGGEKGLDWLLHDGIVFSCFRAFWANTFAAVMSHMRMSTLGPAAGPGGFPAG